MSNAAEALKPQLEALPQEDRAELAHFLIHSLDAGAGQDYTQEWQDEVRRRLDEIDSGTVQTLAAEDVFAELRRELG